MTEANEGISSDEAVSNLVRIVQTIALFVGMGDGHVSEEEMEWLDGEAPGLIRYCIRAKPAIQAFLDGADPEAINALVPDTIEHTLSVGMLLGGPPIWAAEALEKRAESGELANYEAGFAGQIEDPIDQIIAHYFALRLLFFSGSPAEGETKAYAIVIAAWCGSDSSEMIDGMMTTATDLLPSLLGLDSPIG